MRATEGTNNSTIIIAHFYAIGGIGVIKRANGIFARKQADSERML